MKQGLSLAKIVILAFLFSLGSLTGGCDDDDGDDSTPTFVVEGCANIATHCADQSPWSLYMSTAPQCEAAYRCVYAGYSDICRSRLADIYECGGQISGTDQCDMCDEQFDAIQTQCPYPEGCLE